MDNDIQRLKQWLGESKYTVALTGAGTSTESGLPDFSSADSGLWNKNPLELASIDAMKNNRHEFVSFYQYRLEELHKYAPNIGHHILAKWEREGKLQSIITQNVDGFNRAAGSLNVAELHGTLQNCHCSECLTIYPIARFIENNLSCPCGNFIRPSVVLFGEMLPKEALTFAQEEAKKAELFIVLGSSLNVSPANYFPMEAKENGAKLVIINMEPTPLDYLADMVIHNRKIGEVLQLLNQFGK
jgi:NAD-dependent deacetylase